MKSILADEPRVSKGEDEELTQHRTLIRGGHVVSMDPVIGDLPVGDILIEDGRIVAVGPDLSADSAEVIDASGHIVAPGMIDTHRHTWQTQMRAICADWTLSDYLFGIRFSVSPAYTADDVFLGNRLGALDAIDSGVTTILDFSHCNNTPAHSDAALSGLADAGIRATFGYGFFESNPFQPPHFVEHESRLADFARIAESSLLSGSSLLTLGASLTEVGVRGLAATKAEVHAARERGAIQVAHTGCVWGLPAGIVEMDQAGLLGPDQVHVHCNVLNDDEWARLARNGAKLSISVETELNMGMGRPVFAAAEKHGIKPTLSADIISLNSGDLFTQLRMGIAFKRWADSEAMNLAGQDPANVSVTAHDALAWTTTNAAEALGLESQIGSLTPGKQADIIIVGGPGMSQHPVLDAAGSLIFQSTTRDVRTVLIAGRVVKRDGELVGVDRAKLLADGTASAESVLERVRAFAPVLPPTPPGGLSNLAEATIANLQIV